MLYANLPPVNIVMKAAFSLHGSLPHLHSSAAMPLGGLIITLLLIQAEGVNAEVSRKPLFGPADWLTLSLGLALSSV
jgi:hypothetical protein